MENLLFSENELFLNSHLYSLLPISSPQRIALCIALVHDHLKNLTVGSESIEETP